MAAKTLIRSGASLMNRFLSKPTTNLLQNNLRSIQQIAPQGPELPPYFPPSFSNLQSSLHSPRNDTVTLKELTERGFLHPSGLPSLEFFLPEGGLSLVIAHLLMGYGIKLILRVSHCFYSPRGHSNLAPSGANVTMDSLLGFGVSVSGGVSINEDKLTQNVDAAAAAGTCGNQTNSPIVLLLFLSIMKATKGGRRVIARRIAKGRHRVTA
ncbi:hypothetical protein IGI04_020495 [Brassica rapa subsp. trilocularis]|uniref:Uncharacterized protein n=1 Tax=Brassica rapa subsp. trilocularis TaxID=1813537 RepID=A0ABQ7MLA0_BRACM|nr:hypothetical protein IGI04_020495 [Brassica rapa subsp. trilocularis]